MNSLIWPASRGPLAHSGSQTAPRASGRVIACGTPDEIRLHQLSHRGQTILVIDKYVQRLIKLAHHHSILERGQVVWQGDSGQLAA